MQAIGRQQADVRCRRQYGQVVRYVLLDARHSCRKDSRKGLAEDALRAWGWAAAGQVLKRELHALMACPAFGKFVMATDEEKHRSVDVLSNALPAIQTSAPRFVALLEDVCGRPKGSKQLDRRYAVIMALLTHYIRPHRSNIIQSALGLYIYQGGARRRVIDCLARLGLMVSYPTILRYQEKMSKSAAEKVRLIGSSPNAIVTYDNFDFLESRRGERAGDTQESKSITTALTFIGQMLPPSGLTPDLWQPNIPLSALDVANKLTSKIWEEVRTTCLNIETITLTHPFIGTEAPYRRRDSGLTRASPAERRRSLVQRTSVTRASPVDEDRSVSNGTDHERREYYHK